jgi:beta-galactosidase
VDVQSYLDRISHMKPFRFEVEADHFLRDGKQHRIFSGALHYFRVLPEYWEDRLRKYIACGLNTVETYVPWNLHEPKEGEFDFTGILDLRRFVKLAGSLGLDVIVRPGPYICAEWEAGGFPGWLLKDRGMRVRCAYPPYLAAVERYTRRVVEEIRDLQCTRGGPVIAMQVENEYGSFGDDKEYLSALEGYMRDAGADVLLFTSDGPEDHYLYGGTLPHLLKTVNFGTRPAAAFETLRKHQPVGPLMCMELWLGWFDHWDKPHHVRDAQDAADTLDQILSLGGSANIYMMHGGTNFGYLNGANDYRFKKGDEEKTYAATTTSYDYDAPLDERGVPTEKFFALQKVLQKHGAKIGELPAQAPTTSYGTVELKQCCDLFDLLPTLPAPIRSPYPLTMEEVGQNYGYILYRSTVTSPKEVCGLQIEQLRDRAQIFQDGKQTYIVDRDTKGDILFSVSGESTQLDILVENLGRANYGGTLTDRKGITQSVRFAGQIHTGWEIYPLDFTKLPAIQWGNSTGEGHPTFYRGTFTVEEALDTYLEVKGAHGAVWVNGFCLGRYWEIGPQKHLYVPAPLLRKGENELVIFEVDGKQPIEAVFADAPAWVME